jgi:hypothetical protein
MKPETEAAIDQALFWLNRAQLEERQGDVVEEIWKAMDLLRALFEEEEDDG